VDFNNAFKVRLDLLSPPIVTDLTWGKIAHNVDSLRGNFIRYDTPILYGFMLSTARNDNVWDMALRYQTASDGFRFAGGFGYVSVRRVICCMPLTHRFEIERPFCVLPWRIVLCCATGNNCVRMIADVLGLRDGDSQHPS
jgi:hypothetical protein